MHALLGPHEQGAAHCLRRDYWVLLAMVRTVLAGTDSGPAVDGHVNLVRWAG